MKRSCRGDDRPRQLLAARSSIVCSVRNCGSSSAALPGLIDPRLPSFHGPSNICSSTSAESSTVCSSPTAMMTRSPQAAIDHATASNAAVLEIKLPCQSDRDAISSKFKRSCGADDVRHSDTLQYSEHGLYEEAARSLYAISKQQQFSSMQAKVGSDAVCSMCGDEGIAELLFLCSKCFHRPQHIYCSRSYPDLCDEATICNWCLHEQNSSTASAPKVGEHGNSTEKHHQIGEDEDHNHEAHNLNSDEASLMEVDGTEDVSVSKAGHGKAFEYLLMVAAESLLPQAMGEAAHAEIKQVYHSATADTHINISTDPKMGCQQIKELDHRKLQRGTTDTSNSTAIMGGDQHSMIKANNSRGLNSKAGINASLKYRKKGLQLSPSRPSYRRYKLLADVVC